MSQHPTGTRADEGTAGFEAVIPAGTLEIALEAIGALVGECIVDVTSDGWHIAAVDPASVGFVELDLSTEAFESYREQGETIGLDLERLRDVVGMVESDSLVSLRLDPETRKLHVTTDGLEYSLALLNPETIRDAPDRSELGSDFTATATMTASDLDRAIRAADMVSNHLAIGAETMEEGGVLYVEAEGDTDDVHLALAEEDLASFSPGDAHSLFSIDYLSAMASAIPPDAAVETEIGTETLLGLEFPIADGDGEVTYLLSPRMQR